jgi:hypothetical protein
MRTEYVRTSSTRLFHPTEPVVPLFYVAAAMLAAVLAVLVLADYDRILEKHPGLLRADSVAQICSGQPAPAQLRPARG